ncbi:MAG: hypothetical protein HC842_01390 [Cytophagales bacterium]|nr:hypothetical protein [Cytophagales bacterium]
MLGLVAAQQKSLDLVLQTNTRQVFVSGGFARNPLYMNLLERAYPHLAFKEASINNASALGAALVLHHHWNSIPLESKLY